MSTTPCWGESFVGSSLRHVGSLLLRPEMPDSAPSTRSRAPIRRSAVTAHARIQGGTDSAPDRREGRQRERSRQPAGLDQRSQRLVRRVQQQRPREPVRPPRHRASGTSRTTGATARCWNGAARVRSSGAGSCSGLATRTSPAGVTGLRPSGCTSCRSRSDACGFAPRDRQPCRAPG